MKAPLDRIDLEIMENLRKNARLSNKELASRGDNLPLVATFPFAGLPQRAVADGVYHDQYRRIQFAADPGA